MLKLKDNVDLKELERFGFKLDDFGNYTRELVFEKYKYLVCDILKGSNKLFMTVMCDDIGFDELDFIYDLIQAGLIEKIEE